KKREPAREDDDAEGGGPVGDRARGPQDERPERKESVVGAAVAVRVAEEGDAAVPAVIPAEEGPKRAAEMRPVVMPVGDRAGLDAEDHDGEHRAEPDRPDRARGERRVPVEPAQEPIADGQPRRDGAHGRNALRHAARIAAALPADRWCLGGAGLDGLVVVAVPAELLVPPDGLAALQLRLGLADESGEL